MNTPEQNNAPPALIRYRYSAVNQIGMECTGSKLAVTREEVCQWLRGSGLAPWEVEPDTDAPPDKLPADVWPTDTARGFMINVPALPPIAIESTGYRDGDRNLWAHEFAWWWTEPETAKDLPVTLRLSVEGAEILRQAVSAYCSGDPSQQPAHGDLPRLKALLMMLPESRP